jgi:hypothetical protein
MTQLNSTNRFLSLPCDALSNAEPIRHLIVLVPASEANLSPLMRKVWDLAESTGANIKFLGLCNDRTEEPGLRSKLITMAAMVNYDHISAQTEVILETDWVKAVKSRCQSGDMVVCIEHQQYDIRQQPLQEILQSDLQVPVYILTEFDPQSSSRFRWMHQAAAWTGFIVLILGFSMLQVKIILLDTAWTMLLELLTTAAEFWLILVWNHLFR